jgi:two-component system OmpR family sensor kinase
MFLFMVGSGVFYLYQKHHIIDIQNFQLELQEEHIVQKLHKLHQIYDKKLIYPYNPTFESAIYTLDNDFIIGSFKPKHEPFWEKEFYQDEGYLYHTHKMKPYYLGAAYLVVRAKLDTLPIENLQKNLLLFLLLATLFFGLLGYFLGKLFVKPMRESLTKMNQFMEDATHELNTPISTILTNIELLTTLYDCEGKDEMRRIEIASKTLSRLYDDLSYLQLNHNYAREIQALEMSLIVEERLAYFQSMMGTKSLVLSTSIEENTILEMDRNDAIRLIDNLLSNAIKYNKLEGKLHLVLSKNSFSIEDSGIGIKKEDLESIKQRFNRANSSEGGFGIGLDIVQQITRRYGYRFEIQSTLNVGTKVEVQW